MSGTAEHPALPDRKIGILLVNLGTPDAPEPAAVRRYLAEFLSDPRVVEIPKLVWQPILRGIILNVRPKKSAHAYKQVWTEKGSPLASNTRALADALGSRLADTRLIVDYAMRYGNPAIDVRINALMAAGCDRILIAPLYPHYSGATTATAIDAVGTALSRMRWQPAIRTLPPYYDDMSFITALKQSVEMQIAALDFVPDLILASFHGMPERTLKLGDPYHCHCQKTARLLGEALGRPVRISFQSRFGRAKWLGPETAGTLAVLPKEGVRKIAVVAPGFAVDCLETEEELGIRGRDSFLAAGGENFAYLRCLNDCVDAVDMMVSLIRRELAGWHVGS